MTQQKNPFVDLYVTEAISTDKFVDIFSPVMLMESDTHALFQPGNVILTGLQGTGKSALLNLLKPQTLISYFRRGKHWPLPEHCSRFISAGINLSKSSAMDFGQRTISSSFGKGENLNALYFADFLNYWVVYDLLSSVEELGRTKVSGVVDFLGIDASDIKLEKFAERMSGAQCWLGGLSNVSSYEKFKEALVERIITYRQFLNFNIEELPLTISSSKTSIGEPISEAVSVLKEVEVIPQALPVLIRIDQFEDLMGLEALEKYESYREKSHFREIIFKLLGRRDERVSYRIGARPYAIPINTKMYATSASSEVHRTHKEVNIDQILLKKEKGKWVFPRFAEDVFARRLKEASIIEEYDSASINLIRKIFGERPTAEIRARRYVQNSPERVVGNASNWPPGARAALKKIAEKSPLSAKLGEAWLRQQAKRRNVKLVEIEDAVWETRPWWKKERTEQALLQIAAGHQQRMSWSGYRDIMALSGGNILVFLSICQFIWAEYLRSNEGYDDILPQIHNHTVQDLGIQEASRYWFNKVRADPHGGDERYRFISVMMEEFRNGLRDDKSMSYPGENGFSLSDRDMESHKNAATFLHLCTCYGVLVQFRHTPKSKSRGPSKKWYPFPILTPYFQVPTAHTKEPRYLKVVDLQFFLHKAKVHGFGPTKKRSNSENQQISFLDHILPDD